MQSHATGRDKRENPQKPARGAYAKWFAFGAAYTRITNGFLRSSAKERLTFLSELADIRDDRAAASDTMGDQASRRWQRSQND